MVTNIEFFFLTISFSTETFFIEMKRDKYKIGGGGGVQMRNLFD